MLSYDRVGFPAYLMYAVRPRDRFVSRDAIQLYLALLLWTSLPYPLLVRTCSTLESDIYICAYSRL
jgi:hypothetical protein